MTFFKPSNRKIDKPFDKEWKEDFCFVQAADTQLGQYDRMGMIDRTKLNGKLPWWEEVELAEKAVALVNQLEPKPKFMVICGDLVDSFGVTYTTNPKTYTRVFTDQYDPDRDQQIDSFKKVVSKLDKSIPLICVCGNHDAPTQQFVDQYKNEFGDDYFTFYLDGTMFISLNSNYYYDSTYCQDLEEEQERWLDNILVESKNPKFKHVLVFMHIVVTKSS